MGTFKFAQSTSDYPYDYQLDFSEPSDAGNAGMKSTPQFKDHPEQLVPFAYNNFQVASLAGAYYTTQDNLDKDKSIFLNLKKDYTLGTLFSGELKAGGKYKSKNRTNHSTQNFAPYYLGGWSPNKRLSDGSVVAKDFTGTYFEDFYLGYLANPLDNTLSFLEFLDDTPQTRKLL
ncbi:MAG: hypothetical protein H6613_03185 [Ignavibacteriales bacterium]|nr:hypothetical protein [Ignavibacteriales bacterium]